MAPTLVVLLRGINVGGRNRLPMSSLRELLSETGCTRVRTHLQSGNAVVEGDDAASADLAATLAAAALERHGFRPDVQVLEARELRAAAAADPFTGAGADPGTVHLFFLAEAPARPDLAALRGRATASERFELRGRVLYLHAPDGIGRSKAAAAVERLLGVSATARNRRTVAALLELADAAP